METFSNWLGVISALTAVGATVYFVPLMVRRRAGADDSTETLNTLRTVLKNWHIPLSVFALVFGIVHGILSWYLDEDTFDGNIASGLILFGVLLYISINGMKTGEGSRRAANLHRWLAVIAVAFLLFHLIL